MSSSTLKLASNSAVSFNKFLIKSFIWQLILLVFALSLVCSYLYYEWTKQTTSDLSTIQNFTAHNFSRYHQMIDMIAAKIQSDKVGIKDVLNTAKYNKFLGCGKIYVDVSGSYLVDYKTPDPVVTSEFGTEAFAILPGKEFFNSFTSIGESKFYLDKDIIFLARSVGDKFIVLKIDAKDFASQLTSKTELKGDILFSLKSDKDTISPMFNLEVVYRPLSFAQCLKGYSSVLSLVILSFVTCSLFWFLMFFRFNKNEIEPGLKDAQENINLLNKELKVSQIYASGLEDSSSILSYFASSYLKKPDSIDETDKVHLSKIISDSKAMLFKELHESNITIEFSASCDKTISPEYTKTLYLLVINYLQRAIHRTHKNGVIYIKVRKAHGRVNIQIQDEGFNVKSHLLEDKSHIFYLEDEMLADMAEKLDIGVTKKQSAQNTAIDIFLPEIQTDNIAGSQGGKVVTLFPSK